MSTEVAILANASALLHRAAPVERYVDSAVVLHADNGSPMKVATLRVTLENLRVTSCSRPVVSNDNAFSETVFRICKYHRHYPAEGFATPSAAREWVLGFVRMVQPRTPPQRHSLRDA